jgi:hypothetical protein
MLAIIAYLRDLWYCLRRFAKEASMIRKGYCENDRVPGTYLDLLLDSGQHAEVRKSDLTYLGEGRYQIEPEAEIQILPS